MQAGCLHHNGLEPRLREEVALSECVKINPEGEKIKGMDFMDQLEKTPVRDLDIMYSHISKILL